MIDRRGLPRVAGQTQQYTILAPDGGFGYYIEAILRGSELEIPIRAIRDGHTSHWLLIPDRGTIFRDPMRPTVYNLERLVAVRHDLDMQELERCDGRATLYIEAHSDRAPAGFLYVWLTATDTSEEQNDGTRHG